MQKINAFLAQSKELREIINVKLCVTLVIGLKVLAKVSEVQVILSLPKQRKPHLTKTKNHILQPKGIFKKKVENIKIYFPVEYAASPTVGNGAVIMLK